MNFLSLFLFFLNPFYVKSSYAHTQSSNSNTVFLILLICMFLLAILIQYKTLEKYIPELGEKRLGLTSVLSNLLAAVMVALYYLYLYVYSTCSEYPSFLKLGMKGHHLFEQSD